MSELTTPFLYIINMSKLSQPFSLHWWIAPMFSFPKHATRLEIYILKVGVQQWSFSSMGYHKKFGHIMYWLAIWQWV